VTRILSLAFDAFLLLTGLVLLPLAVLLDLRDQFRR
jgi:hypothetical protein